MKAKTINDYDWKINEILNLTALNYTYKATLKKKPKIDNQQKFFALKIYRKDIQINDPLFKMIVDNEIKASRTIRGKNIVQPVDIFEDQNQIYVITKFYQKNLREFLHKNGEIIPEDIAIYIIQNLISGFKTLNQFNYVHRDLKPEYIFIDENQYLIHGFSFSKEIQENEQMEFYCGTSGYMSPQIINKVPYTSKCDVWSFGCIFYEMLTGQQPGQGQNDLERIQSIKNDGIKFPKNIQISNKTKKFLQSCLVYNEQDRYSWTDIFNHQIYLDQVDQKFYISILTDFQQQQKHVNIEQLNQQQINCLQQIQSLFQYQYKNDCDQFFNDQFQKENFNYDDFKIFLKRNNFFSEDSKTLFDYFDQTPDGKVYNTEFILKMQRANFQKTQQNQQLQYLKAKQLVKHLKYIILKNEINIERLFQQYNTDENDTLDREEFHNLMKKVDKNLTQKESEYCFQFFDQDQSGSITLDEFIETLDIKIQNNQIFDYLQEKKGYKLTLLSMNMINKLKQLISKYNISIKLIFANFDEKVQGFLNNQQFAKLLQTIDPSVDQETIKDIFSALQDDNNTIQFDEFNKIFK